jgi:hypothetical protein
VRYVAGKAWWVSGGLGNDGEYDNDFDLDFDCDFGHARKSQPSDTRRLMEK